MLPETLSSGVGSIENTVRYRDQEIARGELEAADPLLRQARSNDPQGRPLNGQAFDGSVISKHVQPAPDLPNRPRGRL